MDTATYHAREMRRMLERGPYPDEDFFRLKVTGNGESRWINITPAELESIATILQGRKEIKSTTEVAPGFRVHEVE